MIIVQLAPAVELEDKEWWQIDFAAFVVVAILGYLGVHGYFSARVGQWVTCRCSSALPPCNSPSGPSRSTQNRYING